MTEAVWTAVRDLEHAGDCQWQPCLDGVSVFRMWFLTEADCVKFIKSEILGAELASECQTEPQR